MALHFDSAEFASRTRGTQDALRERGLDGLLVFRQESLFYLTGYDTFGYCFFQCLVLGADGSQVLLTRAPDLRQARHTSTIADIRIWVDRDGHNPAEQLRDLLAERGLRGTRLGVEWDAYGLTAHNGRQLDRALDGFCTLEDASDLVNRLRVVKSPAELAYVRRAAELADDALDAALVHIRPGAFEGRILGAMQAAVFDGGGDYPGNEFIIGSGRDALLCRYFTGRRHLDPDDQLTLEWAGVYRHYHASMMRTVIVGRPDPTQQRMHTACVEALAAATEALKPGEPIGQVFDAHARVFDAHGFRDARMNACGYSQGTTFSPTWMDWPMFYAGNPVPAEPGMVFFLHMILMDSERERAMTLGHTVIVGERGCEVLSRHDQSLILC